MTHSALLVQFLNGLAGASPLILVGAGLSLIFGVTRIVNFPGCQQLFVDTLKVW